MYQFRDVTEAGGLPSLPSEAFKVNGVYLEEVVPGYRTLYAKGREAMTAEVETTDIKSRDGATIRHKRYPARELTVGYQILTHSPEEFRAAYNKLAGELAVDEAELIFNDEPDKFFIGTATEFDDVDEGRCSVTGKYKIFCEDPLKYSVTEYEAVPSAEEPDVIAVDYHGTYRSRPKFHVEFYKEQETDGEAVTELTGAGDCGFVSFFTGDEKIIQLGDPAEEDTAPVPPSQTLTYQSFRRSTAWSSACQSRWLLNTAKTTMDNMTLAGSMKSAAAYSGASRTSGYFLRPASYGTGTGYHGPSLTRNLPADKAGQTGAKDFTFSWGQKFCISTSRSATKQIGMFQASVMSGTGEDRHVIAGVIIRKSYTGKYAYVRYIVNDMEVLKLKLDVSYYNKYFGASRSANRRRHIKAVKPAQTARITKSGDTITFDTWGIKRVFTCEALAEVEATQVQFYFGQYGTRTPVSYNGIYWAKFVKDNCQTWKDVPNKFSADDVLDADCATGEILHNGLSAPALGAVGNNWEDFLLVPGVNRIGLAYSDWLDDAHKPAISVRYREAFL